MLQALKSAVIYVVVFCVIIKVVFSIKTKCSFSLDAVPSPVYRAREMFNSPIKTTAQHLFSQPTSLSALQPLQDY